MTSDNRRCYQCGKPYPVPVVSGSMDVLRLRQRGWQPADGNGWVCPECVILFEGPPDLPFTDDTTGSDAELRALVRGTAAMGAGE